MTNSNNKQIWFYIGGGLVLGVILLAWLLVVRPNRGVHLSDDSSLGLKSGDILIHDKEKIWLLNSSDYTLSLVLDVTHEGFAIGGDVRVSPQHDAIYLTATRSQAASQPFLLLRYGLEDKSLQTISDIPGLARISPIFPDGKHAIIDLPPPQSDPSLISICVLEFETGDCIPIGQDVPISIDASMWLSKDTLVVTSYLHSVHFLSFNQGEFSVEQTITRTDVSFNQEYLMPDHRLIIAANRNEGLAPILLSLDLDSSEWSDLLVVPTDYGAAFSDMSVSSSAQYIAYGQGLQLEVKDLRSGETAANLDNVLYSSWIRDTNTLIAYIEQLDFPDILSDELIVVDASSGQTQVIKELDHQVYIVRVP